jgi:ABC-type transport system involved in multi-copper enzyme maturation permease subunit
MLTLAGLTIREAVRRRVFVASLLIAGIFFLWAILPLPMRTGPFVGWDMDTARDNIGKIFAWMGCGMIKFFSSVLAVTLAAGAITAEVDKGVLSVVIPKPLPRAAIYFGKWLGYLTLLAISVAVWALLLVFAIWHQTGTYHPRIFMGILATCLFPLLFVTITLCFSSFASYALSAGLALIAAGVALAEDTLLLLSRILDAHILQTVSHAVGYIVPLGKMNHWITRGLGNAGIDMSAFAPRGPGESAIATSTGDLAYIVGYIVVFMVVGLVVFQRRDL